MEKESPIDAARRRSAIHGFPIEERNQDMNPPALEQKIEKIAGSLSRFKIRELFRESKMVAKFVLKINGPLI